MKKDKHLNIIVEQLGVGKSYSDIARHLGVSRQRVHQIAVAHGLEKIWKEKSPCAYAVKKQAFTLGPELYQECKGKFRRKKQNCKSQGISFDLEFEDIEWPTHCPVLGVELDYYGVSGRRVENSVSFDKTDPSKGYIPGNVVIMSWRANRIKNDGTAEEHRKIAAYLDTCDK